MKRTFGRFMSLLLVLAMVLAMVPAALAAYEVYSVAPGATIDLSSTATTASDVTDLIWTCSDANGTYLTVAAGDTDGHATATGLRASQSCFTVTANGKKGGYQTTIDTFTVYVQDAYTLTLTQSDPNNASNTSTSLYEGDTRTLTAKVTVSNNAQEWNQDKIQVVFESDTAHASVTNSTVALTAVKNSSGYVTSYAATTTLKAVGAGYARVMAKVQYQKSDGSWVDSTSTSAKDKYILFNISGKVAITVSLPANQTNYDLIVGGTNPTIGTLTPTVSGAAGTNARLKYLYDSTNIYVDTTTGTGATIYPISVCAITKIYICLADFNTGLTYANIDQSNPSASIVGSYAVCTVAIRSPDMSVTKLEVINSNQEQQKSLDNGTLVFGLQDLNYNYGKNSEDSKRSDLILGMLSLTACIKAPASLLASAEELASAYSRIKWESSNTSVVEVTDTAATNTSATAVLKPVSAGFATITAIADSNVTAIYKVEVYQGRAYQIKEYPGLDEKIEKMTDAELKRLFEKKTAKVEIQTSIYADETAIYELPLKNVSVVSDDTGAAVTYQINGLKTDTREFFYDRDDKAGDKTYTEKTEFIVTEPAAVVSVMTASGKIGEQVEVEIRLSDNPGFADLSLEIGYDSEAMELTEVRPNAAVGGTFMQGQSLEALPFMISWVEAEKNNTFTGTLATLVFTIKKDAPTGKHPITVDFYHGLKGDYVDGKDVNFNMDDKRVPITYENGSVIVCTYKPGDINGDEKVSLEDAIRLLQYIAGWKLDNLVDEALDVNADGRINSKDAIRILRYIAGWDVILY